jgi:hypothetical protein
MSFYVYTYKTGNCSYLNSETAFSSMSTDAAEIENNYSQETVKTYPYIQLIKHHSRKTYGGVEL